MVTPEPLLFAALADRTRLALLARLAERAPQPTSDLARATDTSRQAVTKHLTVLAGAGLVRHARVGRQRLWTLDVAPLREVHDWADQLRRQCSDRLDRLERFLDDPPEGDDR
jgi:DNA-binding transcriptional ArsR family regulator